MSEAETPSKSIKSENLLKAMSTDKKSLEGQSLGRNEDSEITENPPANLGTEAQDT